ncbi:MAG: outer membrane protein assembly factor BamD [Sedimentisphaerales bacterium]|nr:outer membrane protein assembly factor BamD [Sedimentisphaerales bacterium]
MKNTLLFCTILAAGFIAVMASRAAAGPMPAGEAWDDLPDGLGQIRQLLGEDRPKQAYKRLKSWIKQNEGSSYLDKALFLKAQAQFNRKLYYQAFVIYEEMLDGYGASDLFEPALLQEMEIARRFLAGEKRKVWGFIPTSARTEGLEILDRVVERWPGSDLAAQALMMQADYYYDRGRFVEAQSTYQVVVENYRKSTYYQKALLRNAESTHAQYQGGRYDSSCLYEARLRYEQYRARFPQDAYARGIQPRIEGIDWQLAYKHYIIADYYRRTHKKEAADYYTRYIEEHWPDSEWAHRSARRMTP